MKDSKNFYPHVYSLNVLGRFVNARQWCWGCTGSVWGLGDVRLTRDRPQAVGPTTGPNSWTINKSHSQFSLGQLPAHQVSPIDNTIIRLCLITELYQRQQWQSMAFIVHYSGSKETVCTSPKQQEVWRLCSWDAQRFASPHASKSKRRSTFTRIKEEELRQRVNNIPNNHITLCVYHRYLRRFMPSEMYLKQFYFFCMLFKSPFALFFTWIMDWSQIVQEFKSMPSVHHGLPHSAPDAPAN